ncbi:hypothetical protein AMR72_16575 [Flavobacterium psychrophilum]|nr:hypothetical protein AMR72_16575 [Flavobacterium psychrophilum]AOE53973.1 hypothetical protein ALW18_16565 [Flavobacterium psychrophilum]
MQNKILFMLLAVVFMQLIYFLVKSTKDRYKKNPLSIRGAASVRAYIVMILLILLFIFMRL